MTKMALVAGLVLATTAQPSDPRTIRAERFEVLDRSGKVRAVLAGGELEMYGPDGDLRFRILVNEAGSSVEIVSDGHGRGGIVATPKGSVTFCAKSRGGKMLWSAPTAGGP